MSQQIIALIVFGLLPVVLLFANAGCVGEDPETARTKEENERLKDQIADQQEREKQEQIEQAKQKEAEEKAAQEAIEAAKYQNRVKALAILVSYWRLDEHETGDDIAYDSAPISPRHGKYMNLQGFARGEKGTLALAKDLNDKSAEFKGTQGYVEVTYDALRNPPFSFSVECWLQPLGSDPDPQVVIGSYELDAAGALVRGFVLEVLRVPTLRVRARLGNGAGTTALEAPLGDGLLHEGWRHVVMTYNGATKGLMLYVDADDGKPEAVLPPPSQPTAWVEYKAVEGTANPSLRIGAGQEEAPGTPTIGGFFHGRIDEMALYRDVLDGPTIQAHYWAAT